MPQRRAPAAGRAERWDEDAYGYGRRDVPRNEWPEAYGYDPRDRDGAGIWDESEQWDGAEQWEGAHQWDGAERWDDDEQAAAWAAHDEWRQPAATAATPRRDLGEDLRGAREWLMRASGLAEATPGVDRAARLLECALALIFYWFGFLKLFPHVSPAEELGGRTVEALTLHLLPFRLGVTLLGLLEIGLAIGLYLIPRYTWVLWLVLAHLVGTFAPFLLFPGMTLGSVPGSLTLVGQYIVKNVVLLGAVWFLIQHHRTLGLKLRRR